MSSWSAVGLVASRELSTRLQGVRDHHRGDARAHRRREPGGEAAQWWRCRHDVGFTGPTAALSAPLQASAKAIGESVATQVADETAGRAKVSDGSLDALLVGDGRNIEIVVKKDLDGKLKNALNVLAGQLALNQQVIELGGDPARVSAVVAGARAEIRPMEQPYDYNKQQLALGIIAGILIYLSLLMNGQMVAQGVVEEKRRRRAVSSNCSFRRCGLGN
jgi:ABC-2 type transport system permease protein